MSPALLPGSIVAMTDQAADRLLRLDNGDAALLYLHLLRYGQVNNLKWDPARLDSAHMALKTIGMAPDISPVPDVSAHPLPVPQYRQDDVAEALTDQEGMFQSLSNAVEEMLGKKLTTPDLTNLLTLYDHLALPPEVILTLVSWCCEEQERKYGPGRKPFMSQIKKEGFIWARKGVDTIERADAHIAQLTRLRGREAEVLRLLDISPRPLVEKEKTYIAAWDEMGFDNETIRMAYERTVLKKQSMDWTYMNGILRRWHEKGLHSAAAIAAADRDFRPRAGAPVTTPAYPDTTPQQDDSEQLSRLLAQMKQEG